jgi:hypothetical protein
LWRPIKAAGDSALQPVRPMEDLFFNVFGHVFGRLDAARILLVKFTG